MHKRDSPPLNSQPSFFFYGFSSPNTYEAPIVCQSLGKQKNESLEEQKTLHTQGK